MTILCSAEPAGNYWADLSAMMVCVSVLPFAGLLLLIAIMPLIPKVAHFWEKNLNKLILAAICGIAGVMLFYLPTQDHMTVVHTYIEYIAFITLLASLFVVSGGIHISGAFAGFPYVNTIFLGIGAVLANLMGTTGASMILIRPLIRANRLRQHKTHIIIFFIFVVSNCAGLLTPLGDPPLYLGFLRGVPFDWTLRLLPQWAFMVFTLLFLFHIIDERMFDKEDVETKGSLVEDVKNAETKIKIDGWWNIFFLIGIVATIVVSGYILFPYLKKNYGEEEAEVGAKVFQIVVMAIIAFISYSLTKKEIREQNEFSFAPIQEVAALFFGIFGAMIPALAILEHKGKTMDINQPWQYFWTSGALSSFLDNAPTYLTYSTLASGKNGLNPENLGELAEKAPHLLAAISTGAVLMGANTYIGNGPNFMVKAIAEQSKIKMPSFGGYMLWSVCILIPLFIIATFIFFK